MYVNPTWSWSRVWNESSGKIVAQPFSERYERGLQIWPPPEGLTMLGSHNEMDHDVVVEEAPPPLLDPMLICLTDGKNPVSLL